jgi:hypothetical protein
MRKPQLIAVCVLTCIAAACGGESEPGTNYFKGPPVDPGSDGSAGTDTQYPQFQAVDYPAGPYGTEQGSVLANYELLGWSRPVEAEYNVDNFHTVSFADLYDPNGEKGLKWIFLNSSAVWCTVCKAEYKWMRDNGTYAKYQPQGVEFVCSLFEDGSNPPKPAKPTDLKNWGSSYEVAFPMMLDPGFKFGRFFTADATPMNLIVDARTMVIKDKVLGGDIKSMLAKIDNYLAAEQ